MWNQRNIKPTCSLYRCLKKKTLQTLTQATQGALSWICLFCICIPEVQVSPRGSQTLRTAHICHHIAQLCASFFIFFIFLRHVQKYSIKTRIIHKNSQISAGCWCREVKVNQLPSHTGTDPQAEISVRESRRKGSF